MILGATAFDRSQFWVEGAVGVLKTYMYVCLKSHVVAVCENVVGYRVQHTA